jgi:hypothetical protein
VGLIHQHEDIGAPVNIGWNIIELMNHGDDNATCIVLEQFPEPLLAIGYFYMA